jgi:hypothetical protein
MAKAPNKLPSWRITLIRKRGEILGVVAASDAKSAIEVAIREFQITDPHRQQRLIAQRVE